jgi:hypothetical protein
MSIVYTGEGCKMERIAKLIKFPIDLVIRIEEYQKKNNIKSFSVAVYELIRKGLEK